MGLARRDHWDGHVLSAHRDERDRRARVAEWLARGLDEGAKIFYVEPHDVSADRSVLGILRELDAEDAVETGQVQVVEVGSQGPDPLWLVSMVDEGLSEGFSTVRLAGEAETMWTAMSYTDHARVERLSDYLCRTRPVSIMCQYSAGATGWVLHNACAVHAAGLREARLRTYPKPSGIALWGEVDASNDRVLRAALMAGSADRSRTLDAYVVDMSGLEFVSVGGARALLSGTTDHRLRGGVVRLKGARPVVHRVLGLLGLGRADGFIMDM